MSITLLQSQLRERIATAVTETGCTTITYCTEYLGYLPFGSYHWIKINEKEISSLNTLLGWCVEDLHSLERIGFLEQTGSWQNPDDELERKIFYRVRIVS